MLELEPVVSQKKKNSVERPSVVVPQQVWDMETIDTLFLSPLPFSAKTAVENGIAVIGMRGINNKKDSIWKSVAPEIEKLITEKLVKEIVLTYNAQMVNIPFSVNSTTDLYYYLYKIYAACECAKQLFTDSGLPVKLYFANILYENISKGINTIDDIFSHREFLGSATEWFKGFKSKGNAVLYSYNLTDQSINELKKYLHLNNVEEFYTYYDNILQEHEFVWNYIRYYHDGDKLQRVKYVEADQYLRVGTDFYKRVFQLDAHDQVYEVIEPWKIGIINQDYKDKPKFLQQIEKFDAFTNRPDNTDTYKQKITVERGGHQSKLFNRYKKLEHEIEEGAWPHIDMFLHHIFEAKNIQGDNLYEFGLDWIQITYKQPQTRIPVLCFVSRERNTGKSTFLELLRFIFQENATVLDNERFTGKFTHHFIDKLVVCIDEGFIPIEQKLMKERIKNYSTGGKQWLEGKGTNAKEIDTYIHLVMNSNDEDNFMQIDRGENRFCVVKVNAFDRKKTVSNLPELMQKEVPHFLHFLMNRKLYYDTAKSRFSFPEEVYMTIALQKVIDKTRSRLERELREFMRDSFLKFRKQELKYSAIDLSKELNESTSFKFEKSKISDFLKDELKMFPAKTIEKYSIWELNDSDANNIASVLEKQRKSGTPFTFYVQDWLDEDEFKAVKKDLTTDDKKSGAF